MANELFELWKKFDIRILLTYTGYNRIGDCRKELERVGIEEYDVIYDIDSPLKQIIHKNITTTGHLKNIGPFSCCIQHYKALKTAYTLGANSVLIMEDDIRFLKNTDMIRDILTSLPGDYDYA